MPRHSLRDRITGRWRSAKPDWLGLAAIVALVAGGLGFVWWLAH